MLEEDQILDFEEEEIIYDNATHGQRFVNWLIDSIVIGIMFSLIGGFLPDIPDDFRMRINFSSIDLSSYFFDMIQILIYYSIFEHLFGQSPGKMLTQTKVVSENNEVPEFGQIVIRSLCRSIPFNALSVLFNDEVVGWHDRLSKTRVVIRQ